MSQTSIQNLQERSKLLANIRAFFLDRGVMEVDVPILGATTVTDPYLDSLSLKLGEKNYYLQTSPEYFMKRLLAEGIGSIFSLGKVFRQDEIGQRHNPEFTMLEWYRLGFDDKALMDEVVALMQTLCPGISVNRASYADVFEKFIGLDPHTASVSDLSEIAKRKLDIQWQDENKNTWLDVLFTHCIEENLGDGLSFIFDYPETQCALAKIDTDSKGRKVAKRFEVFWRGMELGNGYWELTDSEEQHRRFLSDNRERVRLGKEEIPLDQKFLSALDHGLPECSGIAIGVDRLLMCLLEAKHIQQVVPFSFEAL